MALVEMKKISLVIFNDIRDRLLDELQGSGTIHLESRMPETETTDLKSIENGIGDISSFINDIESVINLIESRIPKDKKGLVESLTEKKPEINLNMMKLLYYDYNLQNIINDIKELYKEYEQSLTKLSSLRGEWSFLDKTWKGHGLDLDILNGRNSKLFGIVGSVPLEEVPTIIKKDNGELYQDQILKLSLALREVMHNYVSPYTEVFELFKSDTEKFFYIISLKSEQSKVETFLKENAFYEIKVSKRNKSVESALKEIENEKELVSQKLDELDNKIMQSIQYLETLKIVHDYMLVLKAKHDGEGKGISTNYVSFYTGFVPVDKVEQVKTICAKYKNIDFEINDPDENDVVPIKLKQGKMSSPFEIVTRLYGLPLYGKSFDPTPHLSLFYFLFFGFCFSDFVYGIVMVLVFGLLMQKTKHNPPVHGFMKFLTAIGFSTAIFGVMFNAYLGDCFTEYVKIEPIVRFINKTTLIDMIRQPMVILYYALLLGVVQLLYGIILRLYSEAKHGIFHSAFKNVPWILFIAGAFSMALFIGFPQLIAGVPADYAKVIKMPAQYASYPLYITIAGAILIVLHGVFENKNPIAGLFEGIEHLYSSTSYLGDFLSYSRLLALGIGTAVLGNVINKLAFLVIGENVAIHNFEEGLIFSIKLFFGIIILIGGHIFGFVLGAFSAFIHSARLQFVEFFSKFYKSGGKDYSPFRKEGHYYDIKT